MNNRTAGDNRIAAFYERLSRDELARYVEQYKSLADIRMSVMAVTSSCSMESSSL